MGEGAQVGKRQDHQDEVPRAEKPEVGWHGSWEVLRGAELLRTRSDQSHRHPLCRRRGSVIGGSHNVHRVDCLVDGLPQSRA